MYPFEKKLSKKINFNNLVEFIDVGGSTLIRAAAKNFNDVTVISDIEYYTDLVNELKKNKGTTSLRFRKFMSAKAFSLTSYYDSVIANWFNNKLNINFPKRKTIPGKLIEKLRYGENPHQKSGLYASQENIGLKKINGKNLSYNNYNDIYSALNILNSFKKNQGSVIIKHANPCGISLEKNQNKSFKNSLLCDPISAFGGTVAINSIITKKLALEIIKVFFEILVAKGFNKDSLKIIKRKKNIILIDIRKYDFTNKKNYLFLNNSFLLQDVDDKILNKKLKIVTIKKPSRDQLESLKFAFNVCKFVKSNAIVLVNKKSTIGIGAGQPSRLDSCKIASTKAIEFSPEKITDSVAASDAFFPFSDGIKQLVKSGVKAIIQPGGSINDKKIIKVANDAGIVMAFAGIRHFRH